MTIEQTVNIPPSRRVFFDLPKTVPCGTARVEIRFTALPQPEPPLSKEEAYRREVELINLHADELNKEAEDVLAYQDYFWEQYGCSPWDHEP